MFITFEGGEGCGKTSVINAIEEKLNENYVTLRTREPGGTKIAEEIREVILNKENTSMDARTEALLYAASRRQHLVEKIWPALNSGKIVLCDRFLDSSLAYQGGARGLGVEDILKVNSFATEDTFPDLTILFDLEPEIGLERINKNSQREVNRLDLEALSFHNLVRKNFLSLANRYSDRYVIIDASQSLEKVISDTYSAIISRLGNK